MIQEQYEEVFEAVFLSRGAVAIGYRLFENVYYARKMFMAKPKPGQVAKPLQKNKGTFPVINDYSCLYNKSAEFLYRPIDAVEAFAIRKYKFMELLRWKAARHIIPEIQINYKFSI